ncbi:MAG: acetolactate synthase small subunit [Bacteroidales bacterium]|nr:acetolactate synthase small subunit [Bacteroidales bacterium]
MRQKNDTIIKRRYTLLIYTENHIGLLNRISIIFTRHKVNIETLNTSSCMHKSLHSFVITINTTKAQAKHLCKCIEKQVEVAKAFLYREDQIIAQEVALYKISCTEKQPFSKLQNIIRTSNVRVLAVEGDFIVLEKTGTQIDTQDFLKKLKDFDVREFIQSGRVIVTRPMGKLQDVLAKMDEDEEKDF